eukprot:3440709-Rhodomonas_salina.1
MAGTERWVCYYQEGDSHDGDGAEWFCEGTRHEDREEGQVDANVQEERHRRQPGRPRRHPGTKISKLRYLPTPLLRHIRYLPTPTMPCPLSAYPPPTSCPLSAYAPTKPYPLSAHELTPACPLSAYAPATACPVLIWGELLPGDPAGP